MTLIVHLLGNRNFAIALITFIFYQIIYNVMKLFLHYYVLLLLLKDILHVFTLIKVLAMHRINKVNIDNPLKTFIMVTFVKV